MFGSIVSGFLGFFNSSVSLNIFENINVGWSFSRHCIWYIILFCSSNIGWLLDLYIPWENQKKFPNKWFSNYFFTLQSFSKIVFSKSTIDVKLKLSGYTSFGKIYRLVSNHRFWIFTMVIWYVLSLNRWRYAIIYKAHLNSS